MTCLPFSAALFNASTTGDEPPALYKVILIANTFLSFAAASINFTTLLVNESKG